MKKTFAVIAAVLFVLSFAASAFAIHAEIPAETQSIVAAGSTQITLGGEIRYRGWYYKNMGLQSGAAVGGGVNETNSKANSDMRVRLSVDAVISPNVSGKIMVETGSTNDLNTWGNLNAKPLALQTFQEAWIMYKGDGLFGFPAFIKIGHMPLKLGNGVFFDNTQYGDDAIVFAMDPTKELHIGLLTVKATDGVTGDNTDDLDAYVGLFTYKIAPTHTLGVNYMYINRPTAAATTISLANDKMKFQNIGVHANGKAGNFGYAVEADFQFGSVGRNALDLDYGGWAVMANANYNMDALNFRAMFAYGSGDDDATDGKNKEFQTLVGGIQHFTLVYDYRAGTAARGQTVSGLNGTAGTGIANTTVYNLGLDWKATKEIKTRFDAYVLRATKTASGVSKTIGTELDANITYQVAKNLTYQINAGVLFAGDFYKDSNALYPGISDKKTATVLNNVLTLSF